MTVAERHHRRAGRRGAGGAPSGRPPIALATVVIPVLNAEDTIGEQLEALAAQTYQGKWNVLVCDNGSTDGTRLVVAQYAFRLPGLRIVDASGRRGVAHARNVGAANGGDLIAICDADDVVEPGWLEALVAAAEDADVVGGALDHDTLNDPDIRGWRGGGATELPTVFGFLPYAIGANVAVRREAWMRLGGWDCDYPRSSSEDVDFSWRAQLEGFTLAFAPDAVSQYRHRASARASARQVYNYAHTSVCLYRRFRRRGARRRSLFQVAAAWAFLLSRTPYLVLSSRRRGLWLVLLAENVGRLVGSVRYRVFCP